MGWERDVVRGRLWDQRSGLRHWRGSQGPRGRLELLGEGGGGIVRRKGDGGDPGSPRQSVRIGGGVGWGNEDQSVSVVLETFLVYKLLSYNNKDLKEVVLIALVSLFSLVSLKSKKN